MIPRLMTIQRRGAYLRVIFENARAQMIMDIRPEKLNEWAHEMIETTEPLIDSEKK